MPDVVTFDGPNKLILEVDRGANNQLDLVEVYSEWKEWVRTSDNMKYFQAFSSVGGDPITDTESLGITYFLENGWRIRPSESNHKLTIAGNLFTRETGQSVFVSTVGSFTVSAETRVSSLVTTIASGSAMTLEETRRLTEIWQRLGLDLNEPVEYTDTGIVVGSMTMTISDDGTTTTVERGT